MRVGALHYLRTASWSPGPMCGAYSQKTTTVKGLVTCKSCRHLIGACSPVTCSNRACQTKRIKSK